ncbi:MAG: hypothetical protein U0Q11_13260 [Vicinamibacterales bacterium]
MHGSHLVEDGRHVAGGDDVLAGTEVARALVGNCLFEVADDLATIGVVAQVRLCTLDAMPTS